MRRASSLFEIDQEPLFELRGLETGAGGELDWDAEFDEFPTTPEPSGDPQADEHEQRSPMPRRRWLLVLALAAVGTVGLIGSRLTQDAEPPSSLSRTAPGPPAVVAAAHPSPPARRSQSARPRRAKAHRATPRQLTRRMGPRRVTTSPSTAAPLPAPVPIGPPPAAPAPEPQGFTGEFF